MGWLRICNSSLAALLHVLDVNPSLPAKLALASLHAFSGTAALVYM